MNEQIDTLLSETRRFPPAPEFAERAAATEALYQAGRDFRKFWENEANSLEWISRWTQVLDWQPPHARWFLGGKLNASANCLDRHLSGPRRNKAALIWEGEPGDRRVMTYWDLPGHRPEIE
ncbi:MAG TPA: acetyl-coenzyme A synthetase N-terminal domain-containing protein, partial [Gemmatimonadales bacterium]|nr:acetyl-coenzyme A synthetase N-terminal domain-containing protein [Gemmatimonadales bacterium]